ncbi:polyprenyl synthetase family protein [Streptomyces sp. NPDC020965]|uniref:polyprenyl synthetase family protein n=1 Tax=Streptomyces sp. NPDC020965 TaxID=3365105 RepID=UPI0037B5C9D9
MRRTRTEALPFTGGQGGRGAGHQQPGVRARPSGPRPLSPDRDHDRHGTPGQAVIDGDVAGAVGHTLTRLLDERLDDARAVDALFARDVAERVARFTLGGGRRMRSQFLWWGLRACGGGSDAGQNEAALRLAAGLELIQTCALVHDDVMDGSPLRRGGAAIHTDLEAQYGTRDARRRGESFGRAAAILVGDLALVWADDTVAGTALAPDARQRVGAVWQAMRTEMVAGQYLDLQGQTTGSRSMTTAIRAAALKSALYSVERPLALGAALAGADQRTTRALCSAGRCAGIAFQLRDDLLGVFGDPGRTGKPSGGDIREGKPTYLVALARARAEAAGDTGALALLDTAVGDADLSDDALDRVRAALVATGARAAVETRIERLVAHSTRHLMGVVLTPPADRRLPELFRAVAGVPLGTASGTPPEPHEPPEPPEQHEQPQPHEPPDGSAATAPRRTRPEARNR